jgi:hypothetical protein
VIAGSAFLSPDTVAPRESNGKRPCIRGHRIRFTFEDASTSAEGPFVRVLQSGLPFGKIFGTVGAYRFYEEESTGESGNLAM